MHYYQVGYFLALPEAVYDNVQSVGLSHLKQHNFVSFVGITIKRITCSWVNNA